MFALRVAFLEISWSDILDIALVAVLLHQLYRLVRGSIAVNIFIGGLALYLAYLGVKAAHMELLSMALGQFMSIGVLAMLILFKQEIRRFLLLIGKSAGFNRETFLKAFSGAQSHRHELYVAEIVMAVKTLQESRVGALLLISRNADLKFYIDTGDPLDARVSRHLLVAIFQKNSPLHDGAIIIHDGRIKAARCVLPVSERENLPPHYGLRHRSAIGASEATNALVIVVSEATGRIVLARDGAYFEVLRIEQVERRILEYLRGEQKTDAASVVSESKVSAAKR